MKIDKAWMEKVNGMPKQKFVRVEEDIFVSDPAQISAMGIHMEIAKKDDLMDKIETINDLDAGFIERVREKIFVSGASESLGLPRFFNMAEMRHRTLNLLRRDFSDLAVEEK